MAILRPFHGVRPANQYAGQMVSLPYDVMNREEAARMAEGNPYSFLHICRAEIDLSEEENPYAPEVYAQGKKKIEQFLADGVLIRDPKPMLYLYRQTMDGRVQTGIVACAAIDDYQNNVIKKHELTRVEKELDRINHFDVCDANTEPVFLTYREDKRIRTLVEGWTKNQQPEYDFVSADGVGHALWAIDDEEKIAVLTELFSGIDSLYIADGHHRSASAVKVGQKRRETFPDYTGEEEFNFFMAVIFPDQDLKVFDYNRVVKDLNGYTKEEFLAEVAKKFEVSVQGKETCAPEKKHEFTMFLDGIWYRLTAKPEIIKEEDIIASLDVSVLQDNLLGPVLGIADPRIDKRIDFVGGIRGLRELERRVAEDMAVAFALYPVTMGDLFTVSDQDMVMPPKSTWFEPKLGSGLFIHELQTK